MRRWTLTGIIAALAVVVGVVSMAQVPPEPSPLPLPTAEEAKAPPLPGAAPDDPMQAVEAFVQRNRKEADEAIKALNMVRPKGQ